MNDLLAALCAFALFASLSAEQLNKGLTRGLAIAIALTLITPLMVASPLNSYQWFPFQELMKGNPWANGELFLLKIYLYASFIYMLRLTWFNWFGAAMVSIFLLISISILQIFIGQQNGEFTDPLLAGMIAWAMSQVEKTASDERAMAIK